MNQTHVNGKICFPPVSPAYDLLYLLYIDWHMSSAMPAFKCLIFTICFYYKYNEWLVEKIKLVKSIESKIKALTFYLL